jgi:hypothetical protein
MAATTYATRVDLKAKGDSKEVGDTFALTSEAAPNQGEVDVPDSTTDKQVALAIDVSEVDFLIFVSDQDITLETNSGGSPVDTINMKAHKPYIFLGDDDYNAFLLTTDVTDLYLSNSSGSAAVFKWFIVQDVTPP